MKKDLSPAVSDQQLSKYRLTDAEHAEITQRIQGSVQEARMRMSAQERGLSASAALSATPTDNMGGKQILVMRDGKVVEVPQRRGWGGDCAFVDWLNFTVHESSFDDAIPESHSWVTVDGVSREIKHPVTDYEVALQVSVFCEYIFGFGICRKRDRGANFYRDSYDLGNGTDGKYGMVCHGGQRATVLVSLSGEGLAAAKEGWELRLHDFLKQKADSPRITRVDLAHDDYEGLEGVEWLEEQYDAGLFNSGGRQPDCERRGNWKRRADGELASKKGRTFYVGHRTNGKFFRGYEKGRQLGDENSNWLRYEVEYKSVDRDIPFDVLLRPGEYMAAAYPVLAFVSKRQERILTTQKALEITYEKMLFWLKKQCGAALWVASELEGVDVLKKLVREGDIPKRLKVPDWRSGVGEYIHNTMQETLPLALTIERAFI